MVQGTVSVTPLINTKVSTKEMVFSSTGLLKVTLMAVFGGTSSLPNTGFVAVTFGAAILSASIGPFLPQVLVKHIKRIVTLVMVTSLFTTSTEKILCT